MPKTIVYLPTDTSYALASYAARSMAPAGAADLAFYSAWVAPAQVQQAAAQGDPGTVQTLSFGVTKVSGQFAAPETGETSIDGVAGIIRTTQGQFGEQQNVAFANVLAAPGMQGHNASGLFILDHWYATGGLAYGPNKPLFQYGGRQLSNYAGWWFNDGEASTAYDLTNVVSRVGGMRESGIAWDPLRSSPFYRGDGMGGYTLKPNADKLGFLAQVDGFSDDFPIWIDAGVPVAIGKYSQLAGDAVTHTVDGHGGNDSVLAGASAISFYGGVGYDTMSYAALGQGSRVKVTAGAVAGDYTVVKTLNHQEVFSEQTIAVPTSAGGHVDQRIVLRDEVNGLKVTDHLDSVEKIVGSNGNDVFIGGDGNDVFAGLAGDDGFIGGAGDDTFYLGDGKNIVAGGAGDRDTLDYSLASSAVRIKLVDTGSVLLGQAVKANGTDTFDGIEDVNGSPFADRIEGNASDNILHGGAGNDTLVAAAGHDFLYGDAGDDLLVGALGGTTYFDGGAGVNVVQAVGPSIIYGDVGSSTLVGGNAVDRFLFDATTGSDTVVSLVKPITLYGVPGLHHEDVIQINGISPEDIRFTALGKDLFVTAAHTEMVVRVADWFASLTVDGVGSSVGLFEIYGADGAHRIVHYDEVASQLVDVPPVPALLVGMN